MSLPDHGAPVSSSTPTKSSQSRKIEEGAPALAISDQLKVKGRVFVTPRTTISISNIATLSVVPIIQKRPTVWPIAIILFIVALAILQLPAPTRQWGQTETPPDLRWLGALLVSGIAIVIIAWSYSEAEPEWRLLIGACDGSLNYFQSPNREILEKALAVLTDTINSPEAKSPYQINFHNGDIQVLESGAVAINGSNNIVASGAAKIGTMEAVNSPGAQIGYAHQASGNTYRIDYSDTLPIVARWREHFEAKGYAELSLRLTELERLMKDGTPRAEDKQRVRSLTEDIIRLLGNAAEAVNVFGSIARAAGF